MSSVWPSDTDERDRRTLIEMIRRGQCVLVLGPRVAVRADDPDRRPLDELLAERLMARLTPADGSAPAPAPTTDLRRAAEAFLRSGDRERLDLEIEVDTFYREEAACSAGDFHSCLAQLPFQVCINASLDDLMFRAFQAVGKSPRRAWFDFSRAQASGARLGLPSAESPLVYHLLGHPDSPPSMVLGEGDLIDFITAIVKNIPPLPDQVRSVLADEQSTFLFLGFGFHNWYLRLLLKVLNVYNHRNPMLAFEDAQFFSRPDHGEAIGFFTGDRAIKFRALRWEAFARWLLEAWTQRAGQGGPGTAVGSPAAPLRPAEPAAGAPLVFLSYASEDVTAVIALGDQLAAHGVRVWRDKDNLRVGDNWKTRLIEVISQQVDYVVVVQTPAMLGQPFGVYNREMAVALDRQTDAGSFEGEKLRFVLPVQLGTTDIHPDLAKFHVIAVDAPEGVAALAASIQDDWDRRSRMPAARRSAVTAP
jgi:hypothetical protein